MVVSSNSRGGGSGPAAGEDSEYTVLEACDGASFYNFMINLSRPGAAAGTGGGGDSNGAAGSGGDRIGTNSSVSPSTVPPYCLPRSLPHILEIADSLYSSLLPPAALHRRLLLEPLGPGVGEEYTRSFRECYRSAPLTLFDYLKGTADPTGTAPADGVGSPCHYCRRSQEAVTYASDWVLFCDAYACGNMLRDPRTRDTPIPGRDTNATATATTAAGAPTVDKGVETDGTPGVGAAVPVVMLVCTDHTAPKDTHLTFTLLSQLCVTGVIIYYLLRSEN